MDPEKKAKIDKLKAELENQGQQLNKLQRFQSDKRTKYAAVNLAKIGSRLDFEGVKHVGEKGTKRFLRDRKKNILEVNRKSYHSTDDKVKLDPEDYQALIDEKNDVDKLPEINNIQVEQGIENKKKYLAPTEKKDDLRKRRKLFDDALPSTALVVDSVKDKIIKVEE